MYPFFFIISFTFVKAPSSSRSNAPEPRYPPINKNRMIIKAIARSLEEYAIPFRDGMEKALSRKSINGFMTIANKHLCDAKCMVFADIYMRRLNPEHHNFNKKDFYTYLLTSMILAKQYEGLPQPKYPYSHFRDSINILLQAWIGDTSVFCAEKLAGLKRDHLALMDARKTKVTAEAFDRALERLGIN